VQQELIAEIHRTAIWPIVVTVDGKISLPKESDFIDRDGSYIILTPDGNIDSLHAEISGLTVDRKKEFTKIWSSESRFVVARANEFSKSQQTDIFDYLSEFRIYNCIIVSREKEHSGPINFNDVDTSKKLSVYTWFPYQSSEVCTQVNDITILDSWVTSAHGNFTKNTDLFPRKVSNSLNGCPMKAVSRKTGSLSATRYSYYKNSYGSYFIEIDGLEMDLLTIVLKKINMTFVHVPTPEDFEIEEGLTYNLTRAMIAEESFIVLGFWDHIFWLTHIWTSQIPTTS